jgi:hypothetical protein
MIDSDFHLLMKMIGMKERNKKSAKSAKSA